MGKDENKGNLIRIRTIQEFFKEFGEEGIGKGVPADIVRAQILDAFRKEIFEMITIRLRVNDISEIQETPEIRRKVDNIMKQSRDKLRGLIRRFNMFKETYNLLKMEDLDFDPLSPEPEEDDFTEDDLNADE